MTQDTRHVTCGGGENSLKIWERQSFENWEEMDH